MDTKKELKILGKMTDGVTAGINAFIASFTEDLEDIKESVLPAHEEAISEREREIMCLKANVKEVTEAKTKLEKLLGLLSS